MERWIDGRLMVQYNWQMNMDGRSMNETRKKGKISVSRVTEDDVILASLKDPLVGTFSATIQPWQSILSDEQSINQ